MASSRAWHGMAWLLAYRLLKLRWAHRKVVPAAPRAADFRRELMCSLRSVVATRGEACD